MTRTAGSTTSASPTSAPPGSTCSTPAGSPASSKIRANIAPPQIAVRGSGLRITALPSASAGATARIARIVGTLNGAITPTTPAGTRRAKRQPRRPGAQQLAVRVRRQRRGLVALLRAGVHLEVAERLDRPGLPGQPALDLVGVAPRARHPPGAAPRARSSNGSAAHDRWASTARTAAVCTSSGVALPDRRDAPRRSPARPRRRCRRCRRSTTRSRSCPARRRRRAVPCRPLQLSV